MARTIKRKEQSRRSAQARRLLESQLYEQLKLLLPITTDEIDLARIDRIGVLRIITAYYRMRRFTTNVFSGKYNPTDCDFFGAVPPMIGVFEAWCLRLFGSIVSLNYCLNGFFLIVDRKTLKIEYASPSISRFLGYSQIDVVGVALRNFVFEADWSFLNDSFKEEQLINESVDFRMSTCLSPRGERSKKSANSMIQILHSSIKRFHFNDQCLQCLFCEPIITSSMIQRTFGYGCPLISKHELDSKFRSSDEALANLLRCTSSKNLIGKSFYTFVHPADMRDIAAVFKQVLTKGYGSTAYYRLLKGSGGYLWVKTDVSLQRTTLKGRPSSYMLLYNHIIGFQNEAILQERTTKDIVAKYIKSNMHRRQQLKEAAKMSSIIHRRPGAKSVPKIEVKSAKAPTQQQQQTVLKANSKTPGTSSALQNIVPDNSLKLKTAEFLELCNEVGPLSKATETGLTPLIGYLHNPTAGLDLSKFKDVLENPSRMIDADFLAAMNDERNAVGLKAIVKTEQDAHEQNGGCSKEVELTLQTPVFVNNPDVPKTVIKRD